MITVRNKKAFTLVELLIALMISGILIGITTSIYNLFRKSIIQDQAQADISQNGRVALDRISRELRQTPDIITEFPVDESDTSITQPGAIEFEDGHSNDLTYKRYYVSQGELRMDLKEYYFSYQTGLRVKWNSLGNGNIAPSSRVISTSLIAEKMDAFRIYGGNILQVDLFTNDTNSQPYHLRTSIAARNL